MRQNIGKIASTSGHKQYRKLDADIITSVFSIMAQKQTFRKFAILRAANYITNIIKSIIING